MDNPDLGVRLSAVLSPTRIESELFMWVFILPITSFKEFNFLENSFALEFLYIFEELESFKFSVIYELHKSWENPVLVFLN